MWLRNRRISIEAIGVIIIFVTALLQAFVTYGTNAKYSYPFEFIMIIVVLLFSTYDRITTGMLQISAANERIERHSSWNFFELIRNGIVTLFKGIGFKYLGLICSSRLQLRFGTSRQTTIIGIKIKFYW